ncbi:hypothetical protein [Taibaiella koreensis]|uniref:hypothetical protein n=1 Tax=Taibaiella koreensis TaxID=1268548 RepID=UPI000E59DD36|nr:hypothetical protein [Taibaiella koreensis]
MTFFPDEQELLSSNGNKVILTNQRIHLSDQSWGLAYHITFFLEDISSVRMFYTSKTIFIVIATLCFLYALVTIFIVDSSNVLLLPALLAGLASLVLWGLSRKHLISIHPHGGRPLELAVNGVADLQVDNFLHKLQWAKAQRINKLFRL